jgi:hypothetical protein
MCWCPSLHLNNKYANYLPTYLLYAFTNFSHSTQFFFFFSFFFFKEIHSIFWTLSWLETFKLKAIHYIMRWWHIDLDLKFDNFYLTIFYWKFCFKTCWKFLQWISYCCLVCSLDYKKFWDKRVQKLYFYQKNISYVNMNIVIIFLFPFQNTRK